MNRRTVLLLAAVPLALTLLGLGAVAWGLTPHGGPHVDDPEVRRAHAAGQQAVAATADELARGAVVLDRRTWDRCLRGSRAVGGLGVDTGYALRCEAGSTLHLSGGPLASWAADASALHDRLVAGGWVPRERALPELVSEPPAGGGFDGRPGPADRAAAGYVAPDGTELSVLLSQRDERPTGEVDDDGARGWETADRLPADGYGVVLRLSVVTFEG